MGRKAIPAICFVFLLASVALPWQIDLPDLIVLDAGDRSQTIPIEFRTLWSTAPLTGTFDVWLSDPELVRVHVTNNAVTLLPRLLEGRGTVGIRSFPVLGQFDYVVRPDYRDREGDGYPDVAQLKSESDRRLFRERFVAIARSQLISESSLWRDRDCSGLVRFAYRESLKQHDQSWFAQFGGPVIGSPDIQAFRYPRIPVLGDRLFRIKPGAFSPDRLSEDFSAFASAFYLHSYNTVLVGKREQMAVSGDLVFFYQPLFFEYPYHVMIYAGGGRLIYHTGPIEGDEGRLVEARLDELRKHPDPRWRPVAENPSFLGFYRWKILN